MTDRQADRVWLGVVGLLTSAWIVSATGRLGWTIDETFYVRAALTDWTGRPNNTGRMTDWGTMPLPAHVQAAPMAAWEMAVGPGTPAQRLRAARTTSLLFWWLLLASAQRLGRQAAGVWGGRLALTLVGADPTLLGHACLATTDVPLTAAVVALAAHAWNGSARGWRWVLGAGGWFGIAVLCKLSGVTYGLAVLAVGEAARLAVERRWAKPREWGRSLGSIVVVVGVGGVLAVTYCGFDPPTDPAVEKYPVLATWPTIPRAVVAGLFQLRHNEHGRGCFLFGTWHPGPVWYYFPAALLVKLPAGVIVLGLALLARPRALANRLFIAAVVGLLLVLPSRLPLGVRLVAPVMALAAVGLAVAAVRAGWVRTGWLAAGLSVVASLSVWPDGVRFANRLVGGPAMTHRRLSDSNVDWGQGYPELVGWWETAGRPPLAVWWSSTDPGVDRLPGVRPVPDLHQRLIFNPADARQELGPVLLVVGHTTAAHDPDLTPAKSVLLSWLATRPVVYYGRTFTIYDTDGPP